MSKSLKASAGGGGNVIPHPHAKPSNPRGRPKAVWEATYGAELDRRMKAGEALPYVLAESKALAGWGEDHDIRAPGIMAHHTIIGVDAIRRRILKRFKSTAGYRAALEFHRPKAATGI